MKLPIGNTEEATRLLNEGADVHAKDDLGFDPLHYAVLHGKTFGIENISFKNTDEIFP